MPKSKLALARRRISNGSIVAFGALRSGLDFFHTGLLFFPKLSVGPLEEMVLYHASRDAKKVVAEPIYDFLQRNRMREITFADGESRELEARIVPAATVAGQLYCVGGEPLPGNTELRIVPSSARPQDPLDRTWTKKAVLERNALLSGEHHDTFEVGPLSPADYLVAVRPATFDRWTWAYGTENGAEAQSFAARRGEKIAVGAIAVDCECKLRLILGEIDLGVSGRVDQDIGLI